MIVIQLCPELNRGGIERGVVDVAVHLKKLGHDSIVISNGGLLVKELKDNQVKHISLPIHSKNPARFILNLRTLTSVLKKIQPNLILVYSRIPSWLVYLLRKKYSAPFITHCLGIHGMKRTGVKKIYNSVLMRGDMVVANSSYTKNYFLSYYSKYKSNIEVVPRSVDLKLFDPEKVELEKIQEIRNKWNTPPGKTVVLLPARFTDWKGHEVLIKALYLIKNKAVHDFYVVMVGVVGKKKDYLHRLLKLVTQLDLNGDILFAEDEGNMATVYAASDLIISASTKPEAFGRVIIEAQAMGKIVIASQHGAPLETIKHYHNGFLVTPHNPRALAEILCEVHQLASSEKAAISLNAIENAKQYSKERMCKQLMGLYEQVLANNKKDKSRNIL